MLPAREAPCEGPIQESGHLAAARPQGAKAKSHLSGKCQLDSRWNMSLAPGCSGVYDMATDVQRAPSWWPHPAGSPVTWARALHGYHLFPC